MNLQALFPVFIPYNSGHSRPITEQDVKVLVGILIILHIVYIISSLPQIYWIIKYKYSIIKDFEWLSSGSFIQFITGGLVIVIDAILLLIYLGSLIAKFL